jgi:hypothetical protein
MLQQDIRQAIEWTQWDKNDIQDRGSFTVYAGAASVGMGAISVGYLCWALRGGAVMTVFASSLPAWRFVDPVAMVSAYRHARAKAEKGIGSLTPEDLVD